MSDFYRKYFWGWFWDCLVLGTLCLLVFLMLRDYSPGGWSAIIFLIILIPLPVLNGVWIPIRMGPRLQYLSNIQLREMLALTFLKDRAFLIEQLKVVIIRSMLPCLVLIPYTICFMIYYERDLEIVYFTFFICLWSLVLLSIGICGALWAFCRIVEGKSRIGIYYGLALGYTFGIAAFIAFAMYIFFTISNLLGFDTGEDVGFFLFACLQFFVLGFLFLCGFRFWKRILKRYFYFE